MAASGKVNWGGPASETVEGAPSDVTLLRWAQDERARGVTLEELDRQIGIASNSVASKIDPERAERKKAQDAAYVARRRASGGQPVAKAEAPEPAEEPDGIEPPADVPPAQIGQATGEERIGVKCPADGTERELAIGKPPQADTSPLTPQGGCRHEIVSGNTKRDLTELVPHLYSEPMQRPIPLRFPGVTHEALADRLGVSRPYISRQLSGHSRLQPKTVEAARALMVEAAQRSLNEALAMLDAAGVWPAMSEATISPTFPSPTDAQRDAATRLLADLLLRLVRAELRGDTAPEQNADGRRPEAMRA